MKLIWQHLTSGLVYARSFRLIPALVGTVIPFFWQLVNLYGTLPAVLLIVGVFQIIIVSMSAIMYPFLFWKLRFLEVYCLIIKPIKTPRQGWVEAFKLMHKEEDDSLLISEEIDNELLEDWDDSKH
jgi:hypothetical protein